jgi:hypothetical protein
VKTALPAASSAPAPSAAPSGTAAAPTSASSTTAAPGATAAPTAQPSAAQDAGQLFQSGRDAFKAERYADALDLFKKSYALEATPGTLLNIALTEEKLGKTGTALRDFERVVGLFKSDDDRMPIAKDGVARAAARAPHLKIDRAAGAPPTMAIKIDGEALAAGLLGEDQVLDPGPHTITTSVFGFEDRAYQLQLTEGQHLALAVETGKRTLVAGPVATVVASAAPPENHARLGALALGGAGILSLGVGLVTGIVAISKKGELDTTCPVGTPVCSPDAQHTVGAARAFADVSTGTLVLGAVAVAAGATLLFTVGDGKRLFVSASAAPGSGGLAATGKF